MLWLIVRRFSEEEWRMLKAFSQASGKNSLQFRLLEALRAMASYDAAAERAQFASVNLSSMRHTAKKWLLVTSRKLGLGLRQAENLCIDIDTLIGWGDIEGAQELIGEARAIVDGTEDFDLQLRLIQLESKLVATSQRTAEGADRLEALAEDAIKVTEYLRLEAQVQLHVARYWERVRNEFLSTGILKTEIAEQYLSTDLHHQEVQGWPARLQIEKLRIDELIFYVLGRNASAIACSLQMRALFEAHPALIGKQQLEYAKCLFRLGTYHATTGRLDQSLDILERFREMRPWEGENKAELLKRYLYLVFRYSFETHDLPFAHEASKDVKTYWNNLLSAPYDRTLVFVLLLVASYNLAIGELDDAKESLAKIETQGSATGGIQVQSVFRFLHLMVLIEEKDAIGHKSFGTNYKRHLKKMDSIAPVCMEVLKNLCQPALTGNPSQISIAAKKLLRYFEQLLSSEDPSFSPFIYPMKKWVQRLLSKHPR